MLDWRKIERKEERKRCDGETETKRKAKLLLQRLDSLLPESPDLTLHSTSRSECRVAKVSAGLLLLEVVETLSLSVELDRRVETKRSQQGLREVVVGRRWVYEQL